VEKVYPLQLKKLPKVNNPPQGENSPNLVTLENMQKTKMSSNGETSICVKKIPRIEFRRDFWRQNVFRVQRSPFSGKTHNPLVGALIIPEQGDQIGRFFAYWVIVNFGQFCAKIPQ
jgi:hypothetical protein